MFYIGEYKLFSQRHPWIARTLVILLITIVILSVIRISLPFVINYAALNWLESQHVEANIGDIDISLIDGSFAVINASGENSEGKGFSLGWIEITWQWQPLFNHHIIVDRIEISSLNVDSMLLDNGDISIAGITIKSTNEEIQTDTTKQTPAQPWDATINNIILSDIKLCLQQYDDSHKVIVDYCGELTNFNWAGDISFISSTPLATDEIPLYIRGSSNIDTITLKNNILNLDLLKIESITVNDINIETLANFSIENIDIAKFSAVQRKAQTPPGDRQVFAFDHLDIHPVQLTQLNSLKLGTIELTGTSVYLQKDKDGLTDIKPWLPKDRKEPVAQQPEISESTSEPFHFAFDQFILRSKKQFIFTDTSLTEPFTVEVDALDFKLTNLDSNNPDKQGQMALAMTIDNHSNVTLNADIKNLFAKPGINGTGKITGFDLRSLTPLTKQYIGHNIRSGQLDVDLKLNINKDAIDSQIGLALHQFELRTLSREEAEKLNSDLGFPLNSSLSLLRDKDNTIRLTIPVTGDIDNPEFDPRDAIIKASSKAITAAVIHYYTPFGLVFAAGSLFDLATALNFEPVLFDAGTTDLNSSHKNQLDKLVSLMNERPGIHLTLCGISNNTDRAKLFPDTVEADTSKQNSPKTTEMTVSDKNMVVLKQLAESRSSNIKSYLVDEKAIDSSRLIECSPEYQAEKISGVDISI